MERLTANQLSIVCGGSDESTCTSSCQCGTCDAINTSGYHAGVVLQANAPTKPPTPTQTPTPTQITSDRTTE